MGPKLCKLQQTNLIPNKKKKKTIYHWNAVSQDFFLQTSGSQLKHLVKNKQIT